MAPPAVLTVFLVGLSATLPSPCTTTAIDPPPLPWQQTPMVAWYQAFDKGNMTHGYLDFRNYFTRQVGKETASVNPTSSAATTWKISDAPPFGVAADVNANQPPWGGRLLLNSVVTDRITGTISLESQSPSGGRSTSLQPAGSMLAVEGVPSTTASYWYLHCIGDANYSSSECSSPGVSISMSGQSRPSPFAFGSLSHAFDFDMWYYSYNPSYAFIGGVDGSTNKAVLVQVGSKAEVLWTGGVGDAVTAVAVDRTSASVYFTTTTSLYNFDLLSRTVQLLRTVLVTSDRMPLVVLSGYDQNANNGFVEAFFAVYDDQADSTSIYDQFSTKVVTVPGKLLSLKVDPSMRCIHASC